MINVKPQVNNCSAIQLYQGENSVTYQWENNGRFVLNQQAKVDFYSSSLLKQQFMGNHVTHPDSDPTMGNHVTHPDSDPTSLFLLLLNAVCLVEKQQISLIFGLSRPTIKPTIYHSQGQHTNNHYNTNIVEEFK